MSTKRLKEHKERLKSLNEIIKDAKKLNHLYDLNEYLRELVMGPLGDTKFDSEFIEKTHEENLRWRKKALRNKIFK